MCFYACVRGFVCLLQSSNYIYCNLCSWRGGRGVVEYKALCGFVSTTSYHLRVCESESLYMLRVQVTCLSFILGVLQAST